MTKEDELEPTYVDPDFAHANLDHEISVPAEIGRYKLLNILGRGGFGVVYLAMDNQLKRNVALKVPTSRSYGHEENAAAYITEARTAASLDHPAIVPVYDVGSTNEVPCYIVSKYIDGENLGQVLRDRRLDCPKALEIGIAVAEALHHAHRQGFVHRDVKPGNILIDRKGNPFLTDFGLAIRDDDPPLCSNPAGTASYMSPEQAMGEGHRIDGRSDVFSLGIVLYEMLAGRHPFRSQSQDGVLQKLLYSEVKPLRQYDENLSPELERICSKALSKRSRDRYSSAFDLAEDLRYVQEEMHSKAISAGSATLESDAHCVGPVAIDEHSAEASSSGNGAPTDSNAHDNIIQVIPRGLRSFDAHDADFFPELLPGPRDRNGLPESVRFWKTRIEGTEADLAFSVGLIYGPSGCGKSSMVKAGLLPQLDPSVRCVYVESTPGDTESRILRGIRRRINLPDHIDLIHSMVALRKGEGLASDEKVLIVIDQFEQWLHSGRDHEDNTLIRALRQCDGTKVQCIIMLRDDFWMAITRILNELEIELIQENNFAAVDLFPIRHAKRVLTAFGRAYGELPPYPQKLSGEQQEFVSQAIHEIAVDGSVICVRLTLFAEMMRNKSWTPATLKQVGGTGGVGVRFLEETFNSPTANPRHRLHQKAARAVLQCLLPDSGSDLKGHMRSYAELRDASGYGDRLQDFDEVLHILDRELRLITPTDPEGHDRLEDSDDNRSTTQKYYQMTHDYLVHSICEWLSRKQKETRKGRVELMLSDRAMSWHTRPDNRLLPSVWEHFLIRAYTSESTWTDAQARMMKRATQVHGLSLAVLVVLCLIAGFSIQSVRRQTQADATADLISLLADAPPEQLPSFLNNVSQQQAIAIPLLKKITEETSPDSLQYLNATLALPLTNTSQTYLKNKLLSASAKYFPLILDTIKPSLSFHDDELRSIATNDIMDESRRFRAACALAASGTNTETWDMIAPVTAETLAKTQPSELAIWRDMLEPAAPELRTSLERLFRDKSQREQIRIQVTDILGHYLRDDPQALFDLLIDADLYQFTLIYDRLAEHQDTAISLAEKLLNNTNGTLSDSLASQLANAAIMLLKMNRPDTVWQLYQPSSNPMCESYLRHRIAPLEVNSNSIIQRWHQSCNTAEGPGLTLTLGEFSSLQLRANERNTLAEEISDAMTPEADPAFHSAAEWLLKQWNFTKAREQTNKRLAATATRENADNDDSIRYFWNSEQLKMVVLDASAFTMGSPESEPQRHRNEVQHRQNIGRRFAISATEVSVAQYQRFLDDNPKIHRPNTEDYAHSTISPQTGMTWFEAAGYCNWLSEQDGIESDQWCYIPNEEGDYAAGMRPQKNYLQRHGYRLPTEAEWEYACRGGAETSRYYGSDETLLEHYAWYLKNGDGHLQPVGELRPNGFGLFDMLGNAEEHCHDTYRAYQSDDQLTADIVDEEVVSNQSKRVRRGASSGYVAQYIRSAARNNDFAIERDLLTGFRPARTMPSQQTNGSTETDSRDEPPVRTTSPEELAQ